MYVLKKQIAVNAKYMQKQKNKQKKNINKNHFFATFPTQQATNFFFTFFK